jgi:hypothetical protein
MGNQELSDEACGVTMLGRAGLRYREGDRTMFVDGEILAGPVDYDVRKSSIGVWDDTKQAATEEEKQRIIDNIAALFKKGGVSVQFT